MNCLDDHEAALFAYGLLEHTRDQEVRAHVMSCPHCDALLVEFARLATTNGRVHGTSGVGLETEPPPLRYGFLRTLGVGGMGLVFAAYDHRLERSVAIKLLRRDVSERWGNHGLVSEARALARVSHPNVVQIYDVDRSEEAIANGDGAVFISMELVDGTNLRRWILDSRPSPEAILDGLLDAGEGLRAIHEAGLVHRDFKPENVLIGVERRVRVTDFGLAISNASTLSSADPIAGTPFYMAPEQLLAATASARSDQFSFAVTLCEALTGSRPFAAATLGELRALYEHRAVPRIRIRTRAHRALAPVLERALSYEPAARYGSMRELLIDLRRALRAHARDHLAIHTFALAALAPLHWLATAWVLNFVVTMPISTVPPSEVSSPGDIHILVMLLAGWMLFASSCFFFWAPIGAILTPISAYGLFRRRPWARHLTLLYAVLSLPLGITAPFALYAIYTMSSRAVRVEFERDQ